MVPLVALCPDVITLHYLHPRGKKAPYKTFVAPRQQPQEVEIHTGVDTLCQPCVS